jgi:hypothetical protein
VAARKGCEVKIFIGIPSAGTVRIETLLSVVTTIHASPHEFSVGYRVGAYIEENRTQLVQDAISAGCEKLFFLDHDMDVEAQVVNKLLALNKPVVCAPYNFRSFPLRSYIVGENKKVLKHLPGKPFRCLAGPTGCMLVDVPTVQRIPLPWFDVVFDENGQLKFSEDIYFCKRLRDHGVEVWCDPTIKIKHIGTYEY